MTLLRDACDAYQVAGSVRPERYPVPAPAMHRFSLAVSGLQRALGEQASSEVWVDLLGAARAARWRAAAEAVELSRASSTAAEPLRRALSRAAQLEQLASADVTDQVRALQRGASAALEEDNAPLVRAVLESLQDGDPSDTCAVVTGRRAAEALAARLRDEHLAIPIVTPREFMTGRCWDFAVVVGPGDWFPGQMLTCSRASAVTLVHYAHLRDSDTFNGLFGADATQAVAATVRRPRGALSRLAIEPDGATPAAQMALADAEEARALTLEPDWRQALREALTAAEAGADPQEERAPARLLALDGGFAIWLPTDAHTIRGLDPRAVPGERVAALRASSLGVGSVLLLRDAGGHGSFLAAVDQELGPDAAALHARQREWKAALRRYLFLYGERELRRLLRARGARTANVQSWAREDNIRPLHDADFAILLDIIGVDDWSRHASDGRRLWAAHQRAGQTLTDSLEATVESADLSELESTGLQRFHQPGAPGAAALTAFRISALSRDEAQVPVSALRRPHRMGALAWLA